MTQAPEKFVGGGVPRKEDRALVTGRANWTDNIKLPGMLHAVFMRSPYAHAKITSIDVSAAREQPGVVAVFTGEDLIDEYEKHPRENPGATEQEIREGLEGNLCRCTGYENIVKAVQLVQQHRDELVQDAAS